MSEELVAARIYVALKELSWLKKGRSIAREAALVPMAPEGTVDLTLPYLPGAVADMVRLQQLAVARQFEACTLRPCDITRGTNGIWTY